MLGTAPALDSCDKQLLETTTAIGQFRADLLHHRLTVPIRRLE